ncbi:DUF952 domain-containing protein [Synechococcus sp. RSCCF101]|uniref:DUF952 domain-containing protein n=1 Tax=Synechococcus sp. RSCCF101 TaxID=2511069 RepID=UPI0012493DC7|nr:DUF952 domain-containing protein [Synechococcus sp. RSCCF101]QEY31544.1 DUF952 domain-containing protein [Synechococcus sp. RSCCF101]
MAELPVLYSFRRCPYALRARLALLAAGVVVELREVALKAKPEALLKASPKGTVPVLLLPDGQVIEESLEVMGWALHQGDPHDWCRRGDSAAQQAMASLIASNDDRFKPHLDRFKYASRYPDGADQREEHHRAALTVLREWNARLAPGGWLLGDRPCLADWALLPFVRQFRIADPTDFDALADLAPLQQWLGRFLASPELAAVMTKHAPWQPPEPGPAFPAGSRQLRLAPGERLHHLALPDDWERAQANGEYRISTRGRTLEQVGFIHACREHQLTATRCRFYSDAGPLLELVIDPARLSCPVREEPPSAGSAIDEAMAAGREPECFPHIYGPLPLTAVDAVRPIPPPH